MMTFLSILFFRHCLLITADGLTLLKLLHKQMWKKKQHKASLQGLALLVDRHAWQKKVLGLNKLVYISREIWFQ